MQATATTAQAADIKSRAVAFNAAYPEAVDEIEAGTAILDLFATYADRYGRSVRFVLTHGVLALDGGFIAAEEPRVLVLRSLDGRLSPTEQVARRFSRTLNASAVPVQVRG